MTNVIITGVSGRMGAAILKLALKETDLTVVGLVEAKGHPIVGRRAESLIAGAGNSLIVEDDLAKIIDEGEVVIDFTQPQSSLGHFRLARQKGKAIVIGTTGFTDGALGEIMSARDA